MLRSYTLADVVTVGNAACGTLSIFFCLDSLATGARRSLWIAFLLPPIGGILDLCDGYVARLTPRRKSTLGADLDSLSDVISFGVAPAALGFTIGLRGGWDMLCLTYFVVCGVSRLARFNATVAERADATGRVKYFEGTPIPPTGMLVVALLAAAWLGPASGVLWSGAAQIGPALLHPLALIFALTGSTMISGTLRIPKP
jgi:CDP-diacylglycerol--serine O-phosphatidyltransferase